MAIRRKYSNSNYGSSNYDIINHALSTRSKVLIVYRDIRGDVTRRVILPLAWEEQGKIRAQCYLRGGERSFWISNMQECELVDAPSAPAAMPVSAQATTTPTAQNSPAVSHSDSAIFQPYASTSRAKQPASSSKALSPQFTRVTSSDEWHRLIEYFAECVVREYSQQYVIEEPSSRVFFQANPDHVRQFLSRNGKLELSSQLGDVSRFIEQRQRPGEQELRLGFPVLALDAQRVAPLLITPVTVEKANNKFIFEADEFEVSYAALRHFKLMEEEISALLDECDQVKPAAGQSRVAAVEDFLINRLSEITGQSLSSPSSSQTTFGSLTPNLVYRVPCLFSVTPSQITGNLIRELHDLASTSTW